MTLAEHIGKDIEFTKEQAHGRQAQNTQHTCQPEGCSMGNVAHHTMDTHHITGLIFLDDGTSNVEQYEFNHSVTVHMKQYRF